MQISNSITRLHEYTCWSIIPFRLTILLMSLGMQHILLVCHALTLMTVLKANLDYKRAELGVVSQLGGGVAQWLGRRISDQGVPGSNPGRCTFRCGLEQVTFTLLSTG